VRTLLEEAQAGTENQIWIEMSTHYHLVITDPYGLLPRFFCPGS
jgi:hypothetical protein